MNRVSGIPVERFESIVCQEPAEAKIYYHYTTISTMWKILEHDSLRATQAKFSNDSEELMKGEEYFKEIYENSPEISNTLPGLFTEHRLSQENKIDCYITCFSGCNDVLSQWRGYCQNDGVSIGLEFDQNELRYQLKKGDKHSKESYPVLLYPVYYVCSEEAALIPSPTKVMAESKLKEKLMNKLLSLASYQSALQASIISSIPLIKHAGFYEENEYRLLITNSQATLDADIPYPLDPWIDYFTDDKGVNRPFLTLRFCDQSPTPPGIVHVTSYGLSKEARTMLRDELNKHIRTSGLKYIIKHKKLNNKIKKQSKDPYIIIAQTSAEEDQEKAFKKIDSILTNDPNPNHLLFPHVKLWCGGHLPIRSIRVSPSQNQKELIESISHYCLHKAYWLKYVTVDGSITPYRSNK